MEKQEVIEKAKKAIWDGFKKLKEISRSARCRAGNHNINYERVDGEPLCYRSGICLVCKEKIDKYTHEYDQYIPEGQCVEVRYCKHCKGAKQTRITHRYKRTRVDEKCNVWGICEVCGHERKMDEKEHQWEITIEFDKNKKEESKICLRCGNEGGMFGGVKVKGKRVLKKIKRISIYIAVILALLLFCWILL